MAGSVNPKAGHSAEWWKAEIDRLDKKNCKTGKELQETLDALIEANVMYVRESVAIIIFDSFAELVANTPVDTGRARAAWQVTTESPSQYLPKEDAYPEYQSKDKEIVKAHVKSTFAKQLPTTQLSAADIIYITNRVEYILALEAGWSVQAPSGFIALFLERIKSELNRLATAKRL